MKPFLLSLLLSALPVVSLEAKLTPPATGKIRVAFVVSEAATLIDFSGAWEVFQDVHVEGRGTSMEDMMPFQLYTIADSRKPVRLTGGIQVTPDFTFDDAPQPHVVVVGAQGANSKRMISWLREMRGKSDVIMAVCTGALTVGAAGLLDGKNATTHHDFYEVFEKRVPKAKLVKSTGYIRSDEVVYTSTGFASGVDVALHIVERYFGRAAAKNAATYMEYKKD